MDKNIPPGNLQLNLGQIAELIGGKVFGDPLLFVQRLTSVETADEDGLAFAETQAIADQASGRVAALLVKQGVVVHSGSYIVVSDPRMAFLILLRRADLKNPTSDQRELAFVHPDAIIGENVIIGAFAFVEKGARIGNNCTIMPFAYIGQNCILGNDCSISVHACLIQNVILGSNCIVHPGAILGAEGFGFIWNGEEQIKIPQTGRVSLGDHCEIGALTAIDRATSGSTTLGTDIKLDNLVQIGHNTQIGDHTVIAAGSQIGGTSKIGARVTIGGQSGMADHMSICDDVMLGGRTGVSRSIKKPGAYNGNPPIPFHDGVKAMMITNRLPELLQRLIEAERKIADLEKRS